MPFFCWVGYFCDDFGKNGGGKGESAGDARVVVEVGDVEAAVEDNKDSTGDSGSASRAGSGRCITIGECEDRAAEGGGVRREWGEEATREGTGRPPGEPGEEKGAANAERRMSFFGPGVRESVERPRLSNCPVGCSRGWRTSGLCCGEVARALLARLCGGGVCASLTGLEMTLLGLEWGLYERGALGGVEIIVFTVGGLRSGVFGLS